eukprot:CAMPEP_0175327688 /NCGR_PEP_ID=MMETSP0093-20121207/75173_1 /TAXON_ID=311494 /ORGANISM="Alexandrium monilatum, Strain CCMP3105" /LENGTH=146 /DNA_ID=CAMNT_0016624723 /DNA_START=161 /DNA_END=602 /DNA_ORIENTATION=+
MARAVMQSHHRDAHTHTNTQRVHAKRLAQLPSCPAAQATGYVASKDGPAPARARNANGRAASGDHDVRRRRTGQPILVLVCPPGLCPAALRLEAGRSPVVLQQTQADGEEGESTGRDDNDSAGEDAREAPLAFADHGAGAQELGGK